MFHGEFLVLGPASWTTQHSLRVPDALRLGTRVPRVAVPISMPNDATGSFRNGASMSAYRVDDLLRDADLVIDYAVRVGRLPDDSLPKAVNVLKAAAPEGEGESVAALVSALNKAVSAIAPMTLVELRAGRSPFHRRSQRITRTLQTSFCLFTIALAALVADLTEYLHRQDSALRALQQQIDAAHPLDKLNDLRTMVQFDQVLTKNDAIRFQQYHRAVRELRTIQDKLAGAYEVLNDVNQQGPYLSRFWTFQETRKPPAISQSGFGYLPGEAETFKKQYDARSKENTGKPSGEQPTDLCLEKTDEVLRKLGGAPDWLKVAVADTLESSCFAARLSIVALPPTANLVYAVQSRMAALNGWVLPFLYGLLGASVFVMRNLLDPRTPAMWPAEAVLRVAIGGIAGIVIGWFSAGNLKLGEVAPITSLSFGLAFLAGFSIDILFSVLDRANRAVSTADSPPRRLQTKDA